MKEKKIYAPTGVSIYYFTSENDLNSAKAIILLLPGLEDHARRYKEIVEKFEMQNYYVVVTDYTNRGVNSNQFNQKNHWTDKDFNNNLINFFFLIKEIKKDTNKKVYIVGNDFGGDFGQALLNKYPKVVDGLVLLGCGKNNFEQYIMYFYSMMANIFGTSDKKNDFLFKRRNRFLNLTAFNKVTTHDWFSSDMREIENFIIDKEAGFVGTTGFYYHYYKNILRIPEYLNFSNIKKDIPFLFLGGSNDKITSNGKDVFKLKRFYRKQGFNDVKSILYPEVRHELFFDKKKNDVIEDISNWIEERI